MEFLSCIPETMGGGVIMNAGCFGYEFKDILLEVYGINKNLKKVILKIEISILITVQRIYQMIL